MNIKKITQDLVIHELELCGYDTTLTEEDMEYIDIIDNNSSIGDIQIIIRDICDYHRADKTIKELESIELDYESKVRKELIRCLKTRYFNEYFLNLVSNCGDERFKQIIRDNFFII